MKKVLFIDRDGTLTIEPGDYQVDAFEKLVFYPEVFRYLSSIARELDYELVMVTNQDGLGTESFPEEEFWPYQNHLVNSFKNESTLVERFGLSIITASYLFIFFLMVIDFYFTVKTKECAF